MRSEEMIAEAELRAMALHAATEGNSVLSRTLEGAANALAEKDAQIAKLRKKRDGAYLERNRLVSLLARIYPSGIKKTSIDGWSADWHNCVYVDLPTGQASWHFNDEHVWLFEGLPAYVGNWDGHNTEEKYQRVIELTKALTSSNGNF